MVLRSQIFRLRITLKLCSASTDEAGEIRIKEQILPCMLMGVMHSVCIFVFIVGLVSICGDCIRKITMLLVRSDVNAGNSLSVPRLTAVLCHYPVFLFFFWIRRFWNKLIWFEDRWLVSLLNDKKWINMFVFTKYRGRYKQLTPLHLALWGHRPLLSPA